LNDLIFYPEDGGGIFSRNIGDLSELHSVTTQYTVLTIVTADKTSTARKYVRFEVLTAVVMKISIFWDITSTSPFKVNRYFGGTCRLHLQGRRISQVKTPDMFTTWFRAAILLGLFFDREDGGDIFLRNFGRLSTDYTALYPKRQNSAIRFLSYGSPEDGSITNFLNAVVVLNSDDEQSPK
jgi:hypothetical protein